MLSSPVNVIPLSPLFATLHAIVGRAVLQGSWKASSIGETLRNHGVFGRLEGRRIGVAVRTILKARNGPTRKAIAPTRNMSVLRATGDIFFSKSSATIPMATHATAIINQ